MSSRFGIYFGGRTVVLPGVYAVVNADAMTPNRGVPSRAVAIIAPALGGNVGAATRITSLAQIKPRLIGGRGAELTELAMAPSGELQGAGEVYFVRVNKAVPATDDMGDAILTFRIPGRIGNGASRRRITHSDGSFDLVLEHRHLGLSEEYRGLGPVMRLEYVGSGGPPTATVIHQDGVVTLQLVGESALSYSSDVLPTIDALIEEINTSTEWTARSLGPLTNVRFEDVPEGPIPLSANVGRLTLGAKALEYALAGSEIASAQVASGVFSGSGELHYFGGGSEGPLPSFTDYQDALAIAANLDVHSVVMGTGDIAVLAAAAAHVNSMSDAKNRRERLLFCGVERASSKAAFTEATLNLARGIGGKNVVIAAFEPTLINRHTNRLEHYPAYYLAAMAAGMKAGNRPEINLTNKQVSVFGGSFHFATEELEAFLEGGCMPVHLDETTGRYVITQGITSYTRDANVVYRKIAGRDIEFWLNKRLRQGMQRFIGGVGDQMTVNEILLAAVAILDEETRTASNPEGVLTAGIDPRTGAPVPAYENVEVEMDGFDVVAIRYEAHPVGEIAHILGTAYLTPVKIVASA